MKEHCEKCKPRAVREGIIGTPWCGKMGNCECHPQPAESWEGLDELVRDLTKVGSISKSEARQRITNLLSRAKEEAVKPITATEIAMIERGEDFVRQAKDKFRQQYFEEGRAAERQRILEALPSHPKFFPERNGVKPRTIIVAAYSKGWDDCSEQIRSLLTPPPSQE